MARSIPSAVWLALAALMTLNGCALFQKNTPVTISNFCDLYQPVFTHPLDTEKTRAQVTLNNIAFEVECEGNTPKDMK
jgi:hypothetical protein